MKIINRSLLISLPFALISGPALPDIIIVLIGLIFLIQCFKKRDWSLFKKNYSIIFLIWNLYIILISLSSDNVYLSLESSLFYFRFGVFALAVFNIIDNDEKVSKTNLSGKRDEGQKGYNRERRNEKIGIIKKNIDKIIKASEAQAKYFKIPYCRCDYFFKEFEEKFVIGEFTSPPNFGIYLNRTYYYNKSGLPEEVVKKYNHYTTTIREEIVKGYKKKFEKCRIKFI